MSILLIGMFMSCHSNILYTSCSDLKEYVDGNNNLVGFYCTYCCCRYYYRKGLCTWDKIRKKGKQKDKSKEKEIIKC